MTADLAPWFVVAGLGAFHGLNPAMGWLFAVALGLHRRSRAIVVAALAPIALGHALAVGAAIAAFLLAGAIFDRQHIAVAAGLALIGWAAWHALYGHRRRVRVGMRTGLLGLGMWSFLMANAHGAGLMLLPALIPLCFPGMPGAAPTVAGSVVIAMAALFLHTAAMLAVIAAIALPIYEWIGVGFLRRGWINVDFVWSVALAVSGAVLLFSGVTSVGLH
jgi:hypothetical protein